MKSTHHLNTIFRSTVSSGVTTPFISLLASLGVLVNVPLITSDLFLDDSFFTFSSIATPMARQQTSEKYPT